jgi:hypothetical protein
MNVIMGKLIGVCQDDNLFFARISLGVCEIQIPITVDQFHKLKLNLPVKITTEFSNEPIPPITRQSHLP